MFVTEMFNCDPGQELTVGLGHQIFLLAKWKGQSSGFRFRVCQRSHRHDFLCRCLKINPAICCASRQKPIGMFFSKEETLQDRYCESPIFLHDFISLSVRLGTASPPQGVKPQGLLFQQSAEGCLSLTPARVGFGWGRWGSLFGETLHPSRSFQCCRLGWTPDIEGHREEGRFVAFPLEHTCPILLRILCHGRLHPAAAAPHPAAPVPAAFSFPSLQKSLGNLLFKWTSRTLAMVTYFSQWRILKRIVCKRSSAPYRCPSPLPSLPQKKIEKKPVKGAPRVWN